MSLAVQVQLSRDTATPAVRRIIAGLTPGVLNPLLGQSAVNTVKGHLIGLQQSRPNALGGPRTNFYASAAKGTQFRVAGDSVIVSINQVGIGLRYYGGTVRPRTKKYLTIPAIPEAHGKRASEFQGLDFAFERHPRFNVLMPCLVQGARSLIARRRTKGTVKTYFAGQQDRRVVFWLVKEVTHTADPTVLPTSDSIQEGLQDTLTKYVNLLASRNP